MLACFERTGFTRIPSMPLTRLNIAYQSFDEYMQSALNSATRSKLRKKLKATADDKVSIELQVTNDIRPIIDEVYPLYLNVYRRSKLHFEELTKDYSCRFGQVMPDRVRFFVWRRNGKAVEFGECIVHGDTMYAEYLMSRLQRRSPTPSLPLCFPRFSSMGDRKRLQMASERRAKL
jgi:predicted N-acyltransferase